MPTRRHRLSTREEADHRHICNQLKNLGIELDPGATFKPTPRFRFEPIHPNFARVHDLPNGSVAVTLPAKLTILSSTMITDALVVPEWDDCSLDLEDPRKHRYFNDFIRDYPSYQPKIINDLLIGRTHPLTPCQYEGLFIAIGWSRVPATYSEEKPVKFIVRLTDEKDDFSTNFVARVDRRIKCAYERTRPSPQLIMERLSRRVPLFQMEQVPREQVAPTDQAPGRAEPEADKSSNSLKEYRGTIQ